VNAEPSAEGSTPVEEPGTATRTGQPRVDAAWARLAELDALATSEHADVYEDVHGRLQGALADLDGE
jgi:hypothetical protein